MNKEFIATLITQDDRKLFALIDQHAIDERIRYEELLKGFKSKDGKEFLSLKLSLPIPIDSFDHQENTLILQHQALLSKFGVSARSDGPTSLVVTQVPMCFTMGKYRLDLERVKVAINKLLLEILEGIQNGSEKSIMPFSIYNFVATEACHGNDLIKDLLKLLLKNFINFLKLIFYAFRCCKVWRSFDNKTMRGSH